MKPPTKKTQAKAVTTVQRRGDMLRPWLLGGFIAACVGRVLVPSEAVSWLGDGHSFTMLLLVLTAGYFVVVVRRGGLSRPLGLVDAAVAVLVVVCVASATLGLLSILFDAGSNPEFNHRAASPRLAINMTWEWIALGLVYFLARQLVTSALETRVVVAVMVALAVVVSALGMYQVFVTLPADRAEYAQNPDEMLRRLGQWYPPGSPERARFEDRLNSKEPLATFALTNSLAGFLAPWLIVGLGVAWNMALARAAGKARLTVFGACLAAVLVCLVLTKSRTAYLALAVGLVVLPLASEGFRRAISWRWLAAAGVVLALAIAAGVASGGLDAEVLTEAGKSLGYRWEYWQATLDMIGDYPVLGVGPGDFQNYYTRYKLPQASEEIRDPHNFLLEVWATGGTFAFGALAAALAIFAWQTWRLPPQNEARDAALEAPPSAAVWLAAVGGAGGLLVGFAVGLPFGWALSIGQLAGAAALGALVLASVWPWVKSGRMPRRLPALGVLVLAIHLLAAGGITFPGVAGTFWILMALGVNQGQAATLAPSAARGAWRFAPPAALGIAIAAAAGCYYSAFLPVFAMRAALLTAEDPRLSDQERLAAILEAEAADQFSIEPPIALAQLSVKHLRRAPKSEFWGEQFLTATASIVAQCGHSSAAWRQMANWSRELYKVAPTPEIVDRIVQLSRGAAYMYPNSASIQGEYALALAEAGKGPAARRVADKALELDRQTPHADKKLSGDLKGRLEKLLDEAAQPSATPAADGVVK
jgi:hypothetical protein